MPKLFRSEYLANTMLPHALSNISGALAWGLVTAIVLKLYDER